MKKNKNKVVFLTSDSWWDTAKDFYVHMIKYFSLDIHVVSYKVFNKYPIKRLSKEVNIFEYKYGYRIKDPRNFILALRIWKDIWDKRSNTFVFELFYDAYLPILFLILAPKSTIIALHNFQNHKDSSYFEIISQKLLIKKFSKFIFYSQSQYNKFKMEYPEKVCTFVRMFPKDYGMPTKKYEFDNSQFRFLFFGLIRKYKNLELLITVVEELRHLPIKLTIAGYTNDWGKTYSNLIKTKGLYDLNLDYISNDEIPNLFCNHDFIILPYKEATQSGPLFIAFNYNLPVIASYIEPFKNFISDGINGYLFENDSSTSLKKCILKAINLTETELIAMKQNCNNYKNHHLKEARDSMSRFNIWLSKQL